MGEYDRNKAEFDQKSIVHKQYSPFHVHRCGNIYYIFGQVHHVNVRGCQLFGSCSPISVILIRSSE